MVEIDVNVNNWSRNQVLLSRSSDCINKKASNKYFTLMTIETFIKRPPLSTVNPLGSKSYLVCNNYTFLTEKQCYDENLTV